MQLLAVDPRSRAILLPSASGRLRSELMVAESADVLKRFYLLERELIRMQAGWLPGIEDWEAKLALPELLWQDALVARQLRERILELRYPERRIGVDADRPLVDFYRSFAAAPNELAFLMALARVVKPQLRALFADYLHTADSLDDAPSDHILRHAVIDLDRQLERLDVLVGKLETRRPDLAPAAGLWTPAVNAAVAALPPPAFHGPQLPAMPGFDVVHAGGRPFAISRIGGRDRRFRRVRFAWPDRHTPQPPGEGMQLQVRQAVHHLNEVWAAEMAAACLFDLLDEAPHDFLDDAARWCFDETRHCRMGYERLKEWGFSEVEMPLDSFSYDAGETTDAIVRLGIIYFFETTYIHTKPARAKIFGADGDRLGSHDMDFDWADELIHTHYGNKWLAHFLEREGAGRKPSDIKALAEQSVVTLQQSATPADRAAAAAIFEDLLTKARARIAHSA